MSEYFTNLPLINYDINKNKPSTSVRAVDIFRRNTIREKVLNNLLTYYPYYVQPGERPDTLADQYYGSVDYMWLILFANDIMDVYHEWPLFGKEFNNFIIKNYGSVLSASNTVHHYEQILRTEIPATADIPKILEKTIHVDLTTYNTLPESSRRSISQYDYEHIQNEKKRSIILIEDIYAKQILEESRKIYNG